MEELPEEAEENSRDLGVGIRKGFGNVEEVARTDGMCCISASEYMRLGRVDEADRTVGICCISTSGNAPGTVRARGSSGIAAGGDELGNLSGCASWSYS